MSLVVDPFIIEGFVLAQYRGIITILSSPIQLPFVSWRPWIQNTVPRHTSEHEEMQYILLVREKQNKWLEYTSKAVFLVFLSKLVSFVSNKLRKKKFAVLTGFALINFKPSNIGLHYFFSSQKKYNDSHKAIKCSVKIIFTLDFSRSGYFTRAIPHLTSPYLTCCDSWRQTKERLYTLLYTIIYDDIVVHCSISFFFIYIMNLNTDFFMSDADIVIFYS